MPTTFTVSSACLAMVAPHRSPDESRPTLNNLCLEAGGVMVATSGHTIGAIDGAHDAPTTLLLAGDWLKVAKDKGRAARPDLQCHAIGKPGNVTVTLSDDGLSFVAVNVTSGVAITGRVDSSTFPNWRQCIPADAPDKEKCPTSFAVNPHYLELFAPGTAKNPRPIALHFTGGAERAIRVTRPDAPRFVGVIMPCRDREETPWGNDWWRTPAAVDGAA